MEKVVSLRVHLTGVMIHRDDLYVCFSLHEIKPCIICKFSVSLSFIFVNILTSCSVSVFEVCIHDNFNILYANVMERNMFRQLTVNGIMIDI